MTQSVAPSTPAFSPLPARVNVPAVPRWIVPRPAVRDLLEVGVSGLVTAVTGPTGAGKTMSVAGWATKAALPGGLVWLNLAGANADPDLVWARLHGGLAEAGAVELPPAPGIGCVEPLRTRWLGDLGASLRVGSPWVVVLDDYPAGPVGQLERELEIVLDRAQRGVRLVVISQSDPALPLHRHAAQGELARIVPADLVMDTCDVSAVLERHGVDDATGATARLVEDHTAGWACGVRLLASALRNAGSQEAALAQADVAIDDFLSREVLDRLSYAARDLLVRTSVAGVVAPALARAILGSSYGSGVDPDLRRNGFVTYLSDGSFRCHPLLRAAARRQLSAERSERARDALRHAASWFAENGDLAMGIRLGVAAGEWAWVARAFVESMAVPRLLLGTAGPVIEESLQVSAVGDAEPVLQAAVALARRDVAAAEVSLARADASTGDQPSTATRLSLGLTRLAAARLTGDLSTSAELVPDVRDLIAQRTVSHPSDDVLAPMLDAHLGALAVHRGELHDAVQVLTRGATGSGGSAAARAARADCAAQLALVEAYRGNLRRAAHHAGPLVATDADVPVGAAHAHLAMAWVHLDRGETTPARQHHDRATHQAGTGLEPWPEVAHQLVDARLLVATGAPESALQLLAPAVRSAERAGRPDWLVGLLADACAEALLVSGEPRRALALVTRQTRPGERGMLTAAALRELGDDASARRVLASSADHLAGAPLEVQVEGWLLEARLSGDEGRSDRSRLLVDRALRTASGEAMRRPFTGATLTWLREVVDADTGLRRAHGSFLGTLVPSQKSYVNTRTHTAWPDELIVETLTVREAQVLALLAQMCSTEEIALELFLSVNTIKTYVRGILRKLGVNRRVDAVRRGRELGLC